jgi:hypothetical protein
VWEAREMLQGEKLPGFLLNIMRVGGIMSMLR